MESKMKTVYIIVEYEENNGYGFPLAFATCDKAMKQLRMVAKKEELSVVCNDPSDKSTSRLAYIQLDEFTTLEMFPLEIK